MRFLTRVGPYDVFLESFPDDVPRIAIMHVLEAGLVVRLPESGVSPVSLGLYYMFTPNGITFAAARRADGVTVGETIVDTDSDGVFDSINNSRGSEIWRRQMSRDGEWNWVRQQPTTTQGESH